jgi:hypothetical protein
LHRTEIWYNDHSLHAFRNLKLLITLPKTKGYLEANVQGYQKWFVIADVITEKSSRLGNAFEPGTTKASHSSMKAKLDIRI